MVSTDSQSLSDAAATSTDGPVFSHTEPFDQSISYSQDFPPGDPFDDSFGTHFTQAGGLSRVAGSSTANARAPPTPTRVEHAIDSVLLYVDATHGLLEPTDRETLQRIKNIIFDHANSGPAEPEHK